MWYGNVHCEHQLVSNFVWMYFVCHCSSAEVRQTCAFTAVFDFAEDVTVIMQVAVKDETHGKLSEDKTELMRKREKRLSIIIMYLFNTAPTFCLT